MRVTDALRRLAALVRYLPPLLLLVAGLALFLWLQHPAALAAVGAAALGLLGADTEPSRSGPRRGSPRSGNTGRLESSSSDSADSTDAADPRRKPRRRRR